MEIGKHYDIDGKPIDLWTSGQLFEDRNYATVGYLKDERLSISTVWLGLDHNFSGGRPLIFETMIFVHDGADIAAGFDQATWRWHTKEEAKDGHDELVRCYREGIEPDEPLRAVWEKHALAAVEGPRQ